MCTYITETAKVVGSAKGPKGWMRIETANIYFDHPFHAPLDHSLNIDFVGEVEGSMQRVAVELSAELGARTHPADRSGARLRRGSSRGVRA